MKLIDLPHSPYAARVRLLAYAKGIELECVPPEGFRTPEFKRFNVLGKLPVLHTGNLWIPESAVIMEYLEELHPEPAMRPQAPEERAVANLFSRFPDTYLQPALRPLFVQFMSKFMGKERDDQVIADGFAELHAQLAALDALMERYGRENRGQLDLADCILVPVMHYAAMLPSLLNRPNGVLDDAPRVAAWWNWAQSQAPAARVRAEIDQGMREFMQKMNG